MIKLPGSEGFSLESEGHPETRILPLETKCLKIIYDNPVNSSFTDGPTLAVCIERSPRDTLIFDRVGRSKRINPLREGRRGDYWWGRTRTIIGLFKRREVNRLLRSLNFDPRLINLLHPERKYQSTARKMTCCPHGQIEAKQPLFMAIRTIPGKARDLVFFIPARDRVKVVEELKVVGEGAERHFEWMNREKVPTFGMWWITRFDAFNRLPSSHALTTPEGVRRTCLEVETLGFNPELAKVVFATG